MWQRSESLPEVRKEGIVSLRQVLHRRIYPVLGVVASLWWLCRGTPRQERGDFRPCVFLFA